MRAIKPDREYLRRRVRRVAEAVRLVRYVQRRIGTTSRRWCPGVATGLTRPRCCAADVRGDTSPPAGCCGATSVAGEQRMKDQRVDGGLPPERVAAVAREQRVEPSRDRAMRISRS